MEGYRLYKKWAFPVWTASRAGKELPVETGPGGVVAVRVESEADELVLSTREPAVRRIAKMFSLAAAAVLIVLAAADRLSGSRRRAAELAR